MGYEAAAVPEPGRDPRRDRERRDGPAAAILSYLALGVQLAGILLLARGTALFAALTALAVLSMPWLAPEAIPSFRALQIPLAMVTISAGLAVVAILHRDRLQRDRESEREALIRELESKNAELRAARAAASLSLATGDALRNEHGAWRSRPG